MSGTSLDGVDAVLADCGAPQPALEGALHLPFPEAFRRAALELQHDPRARLDDAVELHAQLGEFYAQAVLELLRRTGVPARAVRAIGSHGQTVRHRPVGALAYSLQLGDPARIAWRTGITTVADFRSLDIAAGGEGAPLAPLFHAVAFGAADEPRAVLNLGGMANLSTLGAGGVPVCGFDTGPGNVLLDGWIRTHRNQPYDAGGAYAASGTVLPELLSALLAHPFLARPPPKSTGREDFDLPWLEAELSRLTLGSAAPADVQATLAEYTAATVADAVHRHAAAAGRLIVCGGGAYNADLLARLGRRLGSLPVQRSDALGLAPEWVEGMTFAWLAAQRIAGRRVDVRRLTGAPRPLRLGCVYTP